MLPCCCNSQIQAANLQKHLVDFQDLSSFNLVLVRNATSAYQVSTGYDEDTGNDSSIGGSKRKPYQRIKCGYCGDFFCSRQLFYKHANKVHRYLVISIKSTSNAVSKSSSSRRQPTFCRRRFVSANLPFYGVLRHLAIQKHTIFHRQLTRVL